MKGLRWLERRFGHLAVPNLVPAIVIGQVAAYALAYLQRRQFNPGFDVLDLVQLRPDLILKGEVWRLLTFMFNPPSLNSWFIQTLLYWYVLWFIGGALERLWGAFQLTLYLFLGYSATIAVAFFLPDGLSVTNSYLYTSLFLAFAKIYPDFVFNLYFLIPVKAKWLAALTWASFAFWIYVGGWPEFWLVLATVADFLLFFGVDIFGRMKDAKRRQDFRVRALAGEKPVMHECCVCGITSQMAPKMRFRYRSEDGESRCYCLDCLKDLERVAAE